IFLITTVNTSESVYRKIMVQNAADAATATVVAWQARGVNLMQHLNNLHYEINAILYPIELVTCCTCLTQAPTCAAGYALSLTLFGLVPGQIMMGVAEYLLKPICLKVCPLVDNVQFGIATAFYMMQQIIAGKWATFALISANSLARENGADALLPAMKKYADQNIWAVFRDAAADIGADVNHIDPYVIQTQWSDQRNVYTAYHQNMLKIFPIFTMPFMELNYYENLFHNNSHYKEIDDSIFLGMKRVDDDSGFPWKLSKSTVETCATNIPTVNCSGAPTPPFESPSLDDPQLTNPFSDEENDWGWQDSYWVGHPKYITMMTGLGEVTHGVGRFGRKPIGRESKAFYDEKTGKLTKYRRIPAKRGWYFAPGDYPNMNNPAHMALASGQAEGQAVPHTSDMKGNARGSLIPVHIIGKPGADMMIYH
ncbi:MAG: hypothetical protein O2901_09735, partial [Verrucomicrobia bacterium]|nr:hypothetical protein [Verrucomicrobiota bacterium]